MKFLGGFLVDSWWTSWWTLGGPLGGLLVDFLVYSWWTLGGLLGVVLAYIASICCMHIILIYT